MHDLVSLYAAIHENPMDPLTWAALADVKEEQGADPTIPRVTAAALRAGRLTPSAQKVKWLKATLRYKGRKVVVYPAMKVVPVDTQWGGGSRNVYYRDYVTLTGRLTGRLTGGLYRLSVAEGSVVRVLPKSPVVEDSVFCGKRVGIAVYVHPTDLHYFVEM